MDLHKMKKGFVSDGVGSQTEGKHISQCMNWIITALTIAVNIALMSIFFDFYYDLNDDVLMKDIMAGVYSGVPEGHNMQTLYLLGAFIAFCYRLCGNIPWYGLFLFVCQIGSLYLIGVRLLHFCKNRLTKAGILVLITVFIWGVVLPHMIALQYTITCSMLAGAALFLFMTTEKALTCRQFVRKNILSVLLVILAYQLRSEMLLLLCPMICLAGLFRWLEEEKFFQKENFYRYGIVISLILTGMLLSILSDTIAYSSKEWKTFRAFFDNRTQVYDFHMDIVTSGEHKEYLHSIGLSDASQKLLANYNFGLDEEIDENVMGEIAAYAERISAKQTLGDWLQLLLRRGREYLYRTLAGDDAPYNRLILLGYVCVILVVIYNVFFDKKRPGKWKIIGELILLGSARTLLWMYILMKGRDPERITHSLYLVEALFLLGMFCMHFPMQTSGQVETFGKRESDRLCIKSTGRIGCFILALMAGLICLCYLPHNMSIVRADMEAREKANRGGEAIAKYCKEHLENFYFEDVYSTVGFSQKIFKNFDNSFSNYDIMGGWICKSPLYKEKLRQFGMDTMEEGLIENSAAYLIIDTEMPDNNIDWLQEYYAEKDIIVVIEEIDLIEEKYAVYRVKTEL